MTDEEIHVALASLTTAAEALAKAAAAIAALAKRPARPLPPQTPEAPFEFMNTKAAAKLLGVSPKSLEGWRCRGKGPPYVRIGAVVRYRRSDLLQHLKPKGL